MRWMIKASEGLPLRIYNSIPSCVPATSPEIEWTMEVFDDEVITSLASEPSVIALGEVMDYMGLLGDNPRLQKIVSAAHRGRNFCRRTYPNPIRRRIIRISGAWHQFGSHPNISRRRSKNKSRRVSPSCCKPNRSPKKIYRR